MRRLSALLLALLLLLSTAACGGPAGEEGPAPEDETLSQVEISASTLSAVKEGMYNLTTTGSLARYFQNCVVSAGAKTGTAQINADTTNNGVFVCFAPYEDPEIALAIVIERGGSGSALASTAVEILNAYFAPSDIGTALIPEGTLLP